MKRVFSLMTTSLLLAVVALGLVGCPRSGGPAYVVNVAIYDVNGQVGEEIPAMAKFAQAVVEKPGGIALELETTSSWPIKVNSATGVAYIREEYGGGAVPYDLVTGKVIASSSEKQEEALIGLALIWLGSAANTVAVVSGIAHTVPLILPIIALAEDGKSAKLEMPFAPAVQEVEISISFEIQNQEYSWTGFFVAPESSDVGDLEVYIQTPTDGSELIVGIKQLFTAEAVYVNGTVTLVWVFPDGTASVGPIVAKEVTPDLAGETMVFATTTTGQLAMDIVEITTVGQNTGDLAVEIVSPAPDSTVEGTITFEAVVTNATGEVGVLWQLPDGTSSDLLAFEVDVADLDLPAGSWTWWASVAVTDGGGHVATDNVAFTVRVPSVESEELAVEITSPTDGITINVGDVVTFTGEVSGGVDPLGQPFWFFPDGSKLFGKEVNKVFTIPGEGYAYFRVKDAEGNTAFDQIWVKVLE